LLVGIFILGNLFSTLDYATLKRLLLVQQILICIGFSVAAFALFIGACGKSAQIPLYGYQMRWLVQHQFQH
jgi:NADH-quinone oxidoreductase subunit L